MVISINSSAADTPPSDHRPLAMLPPLWDRLLSHGPRRNRYIAAFQENAVPTRASPVSGSKYSPKPLLRTNANRQTRAPLAVASDRRQCASSWGDAFYRY